MILLQRRSCIKIHATSVDMKTFKTLTLEEVNSLVPTHIQKM